MAESSHVAATPIACGNAVDSPERATPCSASFRQLYSGTPSRGIAGATSFIWSTFSSSVMRETRSRARCSNESDSSRYGGRALPVSCAESDDTASTAAIKARRMPRSRMDPPRARAPRRLPTGERVVDRRISRLTAKDVIPGKRVPETREGARYPRILVGEAPRRHQLAPFVLDAGRDDVVIVLRLSRQARIGRWNRHPDIQLGNVNLQAERGEPRDVRAKGRWHTVQREVRLQSNAVDRNSPSEKALDHRVDR